MIAQLHADKTLSSHPAAITRFQRLFQVAACLHIDKTDIKRCEDFIDRRIHDLLLRGEANASGAFIIEPQNLPITEGLQKNIHAGARLENHRSRVEKSADQALGLGIAEF